MTPYFFNSASRQLFAVFHEAKTPRRSHGVLLCYPLWHEYMRVHWIFRQIAEALVSRGFDVLRFDYSGCGDSELTEDAITLNDWIVDIENAAEELRSIANIKELSVVGMRFGGTLAALTRKIAIQKLILWDPVISGAEMIKNFHAMHNEKISLREFRGGPKKSTALEGEMLGFLIPKVLEIEISRVDLNKAPANAKKKVILLSEGEINYKNAYATERTAPPCLWSEMLHTEQTVLAPKTVEQMVGFLSKEDG